MYNFYSNHNALNGYIETNYKFGTVISPNTKLPSQRVDLKKKNIADFRVPSVMSLL